jgi:hypothetical protein
MKYAKENPNVLATLQKLGEDFQLPKPSEYEVYISPTNNLGRTNSHDPLIPREKF